MHPVGPDWDGREADHRYVCDIVYTVNHQDVTVRLPDSALRVVELGDVDDEDKSVWVRCSYWQRCTVSSHSIPCIEVNTFIIL